MPFNDKKHAQIKYLNLSTAYHEDRISHAHKDNSRKCYFKNEESRIRELKKEN